MGWSRLLLVLRLIPAFSFHSLAWRVFSTCSDSAGSFSSLAFSPITCSQLKVLAHESIGCFVTHCGWNSTLEALSFGVPMVAVPYWSDQNTNAKQIVDVWKMGIRARVDEKKIVRGEVLKYCMMEIMKSERGKEVKSNMMQWKTLAARAVSEEGSSHKNIAQFVNSLFNLQAVCREM